MTIWKKKEKREIFIDPTWVIDTVKLAVKGDHKSF